MMSVLQMPCIHGALRAVLQAEIIGIEQRLLDLGCFVALGQRWQVGCLGIDAGRQLANLRCARWRAQKRGVGDITELI